jgi:hypothetical protein
MEAICIDGYAKETSVRLPEGIPLKVAEVPSEPEYYVVFGYETDPESDNILLWGKRRFIPLSGIDETELANKRESVLV